MEGVDSSGRESGGENQPRRRRPQTGEPEPGDGVEEVEMRVEGGGEGRNPTKDPLNWFGILVPQSLRHSQDQFIRGKSRLHRHPPLITFLSMSSNYSVWRTSHSAEQSRTSQNSLP